MISHYQYSSDFAKVLQNFVDLGEIDYVREALLDHGNFSHFSDMSLDDRYSLIQEISFSKPEMDRDDPNRLPYDDSVAFLLMSVPYEPLFKTELEDSKTIIHVLKEYDWERYFSSESKREICSAVAQIYCDIYGAETPVNVGTVWPKANASEETNKYFERLQGVFCEYSTKLMKHNLECETDLSDEAGSKIAFNRKSLDENPITDLIAIMIHEIRHYSQVKVKTPELAKQERKGIVGRVTEKCHDAYYALMLERQANAMMGWVKDGLSGKPLRSEMEISLDMLCRQGHLSTFMTSKVLDFQSYLKRKSKTKISKLEVA